MSTDNDNAGLIVLGCLVVLAIVGYWVAILGGLTWGIVNLATTGANFWNVAAIITCGFFLLLSLVQASAEDR